MRTGIAAALVGLLTGIGVWAFKQLYHYIQIFAFQGILDRIQPIGKWTVILIPVVGGLLVGWLRYRWIGKERYHGLPGIIEACALGGGRLSYRKMPLSVFIAALSIGSGASVGPEDPSVQVGANLGSWSGQSLRLSEELTRVLVICGGAAGIAAAFNAPIAGVFFALEVLLGELSSSAFGYAAISAVSSAIFTQAVSGPDPAFLIPSYAFHSVLELPLYLALGMLAGPLSAAYIRLIYLARQVFQHTRLPEWARPALAGAIIGLMGIFLPQLFGVGYPTIEAILLNKPLTIGLLLAILLGKLLATPISIGGGFAGGVFAPALFLGASLGGACGLVAGQLFPGLGIAPPSFALVGMAAVLAGTVHAPLTAILLLFEMTNDYHIILPLMFAVAVSLALSRWLQPDSVYHHALAQNGIRLEHGRDIEVLDNLLVEEVMTRDMVTLQESDQIVDALDVFSQTRRHGLPVLDASGSLVGILTLQDLDQANEKHSELSKLRVGDVCTRELVSVYPDESLATALRIMGTRDIGRLPVVSRDNPNRLLGILRRNDVIRAYDVALTRRTALRHHIQQARLGILSGTEVHEVTVQAGSTCAGKRIKEVTWPQSMVIASIRRGQALKLPHGDTLLLPGDLLLIVCEGNGLEETQWLCQS